MIRRRASALASAFFGLISVSLPAWADDAPNRELPDYRGREEGPPTPGEQATVALRVVLSPLYFVSEYLIRRPIGALIAGAERAALPQLLYDFFAFGPDHKAGIVPIFFADLGFRPTVGVYSFWDNAIAPGNDLRLRGLIGPDSASGSFADRVRLAADPYDRLAFEAAGARRADDVFFGLGPRSRQSAELRYGATILEGRTGVDWRLWRSSSVHARVALRSVDFRRGGIDGDAVLEDAITAGSVASPPGYGRGYTSASASLSGAFDTRAKDAPDGSGVRLEADGSYATDLRNQHDGWVSWGGAAGGFLDINHRHRVLSISASAHFVEPLGSAEVPFTELVSLGGSSPMRAFLQGRLLDRSAAVAELAYRWPVWIWLDGSMRFEVGNVFGSTLRDFKAGLLRFSGSIGLESTGSPDNALQILFGVGTETFESGAKVDSFRLAIGTTHGF
jgi:hypothetical protein